MRQEHVIMDQSLAEPQENPMERQETSNQVKIPGIVVKKECML
jgi:hypothetical protein